MTATDERFTFKRRLADENVLSTAAWHRSTQRPWTMLMRMACTKGTLLNITPSALDALRRLCRTAVKIPLSVLQQTRPVAQVLSYCDEEQRLSAQFVRSGTALGVSNLKSLSDFLRSLGAATRSCTIN